MEDYPRTLAELEQRFSSEEQMPKVSVSVALARRFQVSDLWRRKGVAC
jgi:hypothetical protein